MSLFEKLLITGLLDVIHSMVERIYGLMTNVKAHDLARLAGVDPSTVSRVLNCSFSRHKYAPQTVRRIRQVARQLEIVPTVVGG